MSELKSCPACGSRGVICILDDDEMYSVDCGNCAMRGPAEHYPDFAEAAWNKLPRQPDYNDVDCAGCPERRRSALTWTNEPPKVPGWYWHKNCLGVTMMDLRSLDASSNIKPIDGWQWAGPIPTPLEPEES